jgi:hypothetical protein
MRSIGFVESISLYLPSDDKQARRAPVIDRFLAMVKRSDPNTRLSKSDLQEELWRLEDNIIELSQLAFAGGLDKLFDTCNRILGWDEEGNQIGTNQIESLVGQLENSWDKHLLESYQAEFTGMLRDRLAGLANSELVTLDMVPEDLRRRYMNAERGLYSVVAYPRRNIWREFFEDRFLSDVTGVLPHATGTPVLMRVLVETGKRDGGIATLLALAVIVCILLVDFRSIVLTALAVVPLITAAVWTIGLMTILNWEFNFVNIMATPLILGIGIDDGVHIVHRYLREGKGSVNRVLSSTGKAVLLTSLTTMLGFGSFVFARYQGYAHLGKLLFLGVGLCFVTSVTILPALISMIERTAWGARMLARHTVQTQKKEGANA